MLQTVTGSLAVLLVLLLFTKKKWGLWASFAALPAMWKLLQTATQRTPGRRVLYGTLETEEPLYNWTGDAVVYRFTSMQVIEHPNSEEAKTVASEEFRRTARCVLQTSEGPVTLDLKESVWGFPDQCFDHHIEPDVDVFSKLAPNLAAYWPPNSERAYHCDERSVPVQTAAYVVGVLSVRPSATPSDPPQLHLAAPPLGKLLLREHSPRQTLVNHSCRLVIAIGSTLVITLYAATLIAWLLQ